MKRILLSIGLVCAAVSLALAVLPEYVVTDTTDALPLGATNTVVVDATQSSAIGLRVGFTGLGAGTTTALVAITNAANATNGETISLVVAGVTNIYTWTNAPVLLATNYSSPYYNLIVGVTNATITNGETLTITLNAQTNVFTWTNAASAATDLQTNNSAALSTTNLFNKLIVFFDPRPVTWVSETEVQLQANVGDRVLVEDSGGWGTNSLTTEYAVSEVVSTNVPHLLATNSAAYSATNLYTKLASDYADTLTVSYASASSVQLVTLLDPGFTLEHSGAWATNQITTNAIAGELKFIGSNSLDRVTWFRDDTKDFDVSYSGTDAVSLRTNWTDLGSIGWWSWGVENAAANYALPNRLIIQTSVKKGL